MIEHTLEKLPVVRASALQVRQPSSPQRDRLRLSALSGRLMELSGRRASPCLAPVCSLILEAQIMGEPVIWVSGVPTIFFPPDMAKNGVDLNILPVVRAMGGPWGGASATASATVHLLRSGGFGLIILDLERPLHHTITGKIERLAKAYNTAVLVLTATPEMPGPMASLRGETCLRRSAPGLFHCEIRITKDKRHGGVSRIGELCHGPDGLR